MPGTSDSGGLAPVTTALAQLEAGLQELDGQHAEAVRLVDEARAKAADIGRRLAKTRDAIEVLRKLTGPPPKLSVAMPPVLAAPVKGHRGIAASAARAQAILVLLASGPPLTAAGIRAKFQPAAGVSPAQHKQSIANTIFRLKTRGLLTAADDGWALTAKGRRHAAAAKEAP